MTARRFASAGDGLPYYVSYGAAILLVAAALAVRSGLGYSFGPLPTYVTFYPALILAALLGGFVGSTADMPARLFMKLPPLISVTLYQTER